MTVCWLDWEEKLAKQQSPEWRRNFNKVIKGEVQLSATKPFDKDSAKYSREAEIKIAEWLRSKGWQVRDVTGNYALKYDLDAQRGEFYRKVEVIRRYYWREHNTWPPRIFPPRIEQRHIMSPATHYYIVNHEMTRVLIFDKDTVINESYLKKVDTSVTKQEPMYHLSDAHGAYRDLE